MRRVLIVEDDPDIVELLAHYLKGDGWTVDSTADGKLALERIRAESYQLLVLDLQLPGRDGLSLCVEIRRDKRTRGIPVVMLTARGDEADRIVGLEMGADDYVVKPFSPKEVVAREANGRVLSRQALLENVWGYSYVEGTRTVDVHVRRLREKIPALAPSIVTVKSLGYRLATEAEG